MSCRCFSRFYLFIDRFLAKFARFMAKFVQESLGWISVKIAKLADKSPKPAEFRYSRFLLFLCLLHCISTDFFNFHQFFLNFSKTDWIAKARISSGHRIFEHWREGYPWSLPLLVGKSLCLLHSYYVSTANCSANLHQQLVHNSSRRWSIHDQSVTRKAYPIRVHYDVNVIW
jgi:hypothetical protein